MTIESARRFFMWCSIINYCLLILWVILFVCAHDLMKRFNEFMLRRKIEHFDTVHYTGIAFYKICIILFNIVPWIVLVIIS